MLNAIETVLKTGEESFYTNNGKLPINVLSFWQWSNSELIGNTLRGVLAEFIVASSIDMVHKPREEWDAFDLETNNGLKIEVKSSAYLQSWKQEKYSNIKFGIQPTIVDNAKNKEKNQVKKRQADLYVFCVLHHKDKKTVDPLNLSQWTFYLLNTNELNDKKPRQKSITLSSLLTLNPIQVKYDNLSTELNKLDNNYVERNR